MVTKKVLYDILNNNNSYNFEIRDEVKDMGDCKYGFIYLYTFYYEGENKLKMIIGKNTLSGLMIETFDKTSKKYSENKYEKLNKLSVKYNKWLKEYYEK